MRRRIGAFAFGMVGILLAGCLVTSTTDDQAITAPDAEATEFGHAFDMDEDRLVASAVLPTGPVVYAFDAVGSSWLHSATITPPSNASPEWGTSVAVSGDVVAVGDPGYENGSVDIYELDGGTWEYREELYQGPWSWIGKRVLLQGDRLLVYTDVVCDSACTTPGFVAFRRIDGSFQRVYGFIPSHHSMAVGFDGDRMVVARSGFPTVHDLHDNLLQVSDITSEPPQVLLEERIPIEWDIDTYEGVNLGYFTDADLSGDVLAYENCCETETRLHIREFDGSTYVPEASFNVSEESAGISVLANGVVLLADGSERVFYPYARHEGVWQRATKLALPAGATFAVRPVTVGNKVAVSGGGEIHVLTIDVAFHGDA